MQVDYIALSIPVFFILIGVELLVGIRKKMKLYRLNDSIANISLGIGQQVTGIFMKTALFYGYLYIYEHGRLFDIPATWWTWLGLFLGVDFFYYWFHRMSHEVNALWAAHIVHHQSEEYNLSVALRQSWFQSAFSWVFYLPLAWLGFEPLMFLALSSFNTLYQFWIHTRTIGRMGPLEWVLNTPSHHRVHHGSDARYLDKNHGGTLIIWDRMFGTFKDEDAEPLYGITTQLKSWNPVWANVHYWVDLFRLAGRTQGVGNKIRVFLRSPDWKPDAEKASPDLHTSTRRYELYNSDAGPRLRRYLFAQFVLVLVAATAVLFLAKAIGPVCLYAGAAWILFSIAAIGAGFESRNWYTVAEYARLIVFPVLAALLPAQMQSPELLFAACLISMISITWFWHANRNASSQPL